MGVDGLLIWPVDLNPLCEREERLERVAPLEAGPDPLKAIEDLGSVFAWLLKAKLEALNIKVNRNPL